MAVESIVLAKNEGVLPLKKEARILVTGPNGNSIFLPAGGFRDFELYGTGLTGEYWSSSLYESAPSLAWKLGLYSNSRGMSRSSRDYGYTVRAVAR